MNRRAFLTAVGGSLLASPLAPEAQQPRVYRVGVVLQGGPYLGAVDGLRKGLAELGLQEGREVVLHVRDSRGDLKLAEQAAGDLEREKVELIYAVGITATLAVKRATKDVPIVFYTGTDPVAAGLVESFRKPGGRFTGIYSAYTDLLAAKRLELLKEMVPRLHRVAIFYNPDTRSGQLGVKALQEAARVLKVELLVRPVASVEELRAGLRALRPGEVDAIIAGTDAMVISQAVLVIDAAKAKRLPSIFNEQDSVSQGGLASYGLSYSGIGWLSAKYVQRILLGANPGDLPVGQLDRLYFVINLKTAKALGLTIPQSVLGRADEVIE